MQGLACFTLSLCCPVACELATQLQPTSHFMGSLCKPVAKEDLGLIFRPSWPCSPGIISLPPTCTATGWGAAHLTPPTPRHGPMHLFDLLSGWGRWPQSTTLRVPRPQRTGGQPVVPGEPLEPALPWRVHGTLAKTSDLVEQRAGFLIMWPRQPPHPSRRMERGASRGCLADALISAPSSGHLEEKGAGEQSSVKDETRQVRTIRPRAGVLCRGSRQLQTAGRTQCSLPGQGLASRRRRQAARCAGDRPQPCPPPSP